MPLKGGNVTNTETWILLIEVGVIAACAFIAVVLRR
jgi:hypothetical protein